PAPKVKKATEEEKDKKEMAAVKETEEKAREKKTAEAGPTDYRSMKWDDLQKLASEKGLNVGAGVKKDKVIADLKAMDKGGAPAAS
ncbi:MAG: hypothetical protein V3R93_07900, partial [Candidatus Hydrothermarchaeaceae archaeon]